MIELYHQSDLQQLNGQMQRRLSFIFGIAIVFLGLGIWSVTARIEWLSIALTVCVGAVLIFGIEMFWRPLYAYRKVLLSALHGRSHEVRVEFDRREEEISVVDGVPFTSLIFLGEADKHGTREQMYYWDREKDLPAFEPGKEYGIRYTGKVIIAYEP